MTLHLLQWTNKREPGASLRQLPRVAIPSAARRSLSRETGLVASTLLALVIMCCVCAVKFNRFALSITVTMNLRCWLADGTQVAIAIYTKLRLTAKFVDKFRQRFGGLLRKAQHDEIMNRVQETFQIISATKSKYS